MRSRSRSRPTFSPSDFITAGRGQHPAGEDVAADEVHLAPVGLEEAVLDGDHLQARHATGLQAARELVEIDRPVPLRPPPRTFRWTRCGPTRRARRGSPGSGSRPCSDRPCSALMRLWRSRTAPLRDGEPVPPPPHRLGRVLGEAAPAAADLEHVVIRPDAGGPLRQGPRFLRICPAASSSAPSEAQRPSRRREPPSRSSCRRATSREAVAEVVVGVDVAARTPLLVLAFSQCR